MIYLISRSIPTLHHYNLIKTLQFFKYHLLESFCVCTPTQPSGYISLPRVSQLNLSYFILMKKCQSVACPLFDLDLC